MDTRLKLVPLALLGLLLLVGLLWWQRESHGRERARSANTEVNRQVAIAAAQVRKDEDRGNARNMGASKTLCVGHLGAKGRRVLKCGTVQVGMTQQEVVAELGAVDGPGMVDTTVTGGATIDYWRYFAPVSDNDYSMLRFENGVLTSVATKGE